MAVCGTASLGLSGRGSYGELQRVAAGSGTERLGRAWQSGLVRECYVAVWQCKAVMESLGKSDRVPLLRVMARKSD